MIPLVNLGFNIFDMDKEQIVLIAGITVGILSIGAFIFYGPNSNKKRGAVIGLQNLGLTCFLNTLLQSLASCVYFIEWLETCRDQGPVANSLYYILKVLSSNRAKLPASIDDPLAPTIIISALQQHGWSLGQGEQDAHELFHLIMVSLEEEAHKANVQVDSGLSEVLDPKPLENADETSSLLHTIEPVLANSCPAGDAADNNTSSSLLGPSGDLVKNGPSGDADVNTTARDSHNQEHVPTTLTINPVNSKQGDSISRRILPKFDYNCNYQQQSPFCGLLTSQLQCVKCGFKSVLKYDKFDSLSLHLPDKPRVGHTLCQLLHNYTQPEEVADVVCDGCNKELDSSEPRIKATSLKTLTVGKLPKCLCIHIHRMSMGPNGSPYKRSDFIDFPEYLIMDPFTQNAIAKEQKLKEENPSREVKPLQSLTTNIISHDRSCNHLYRLKAVVVHCGTVDSGHFVTYRRGPIDSNIRHRSDRWYFTSDETVRDATLAEAMQALAYLLFYEKCTRTPT